MFSNNRVSNKQQYQDKFNGRSDLMEFKSCNNQKKSQLQLEVSKKFISNIGLEKGVVLLRKN